MSYTWSEAVEKSKEYFNGDQLAAEVFVKKYALQNSQGEYYESTPKDMHKRLSSELARIEANYPNPVSEEEIYTLLESFKYVVLQGSPSAGIGNNEQIMSISNCMVIPSAEDSYGGILYTDQQQVQLMKRRCGVGHDISKIRPQGMETRNAALTTDGISVFMERFSNSCREVASKNRRGALMLSISVHHPEILTFINIKRDLKKVTGANISVRLSDEFMEAVRNESEYELRFPCEGPEAGSVVSVRHSAMEVWNALMEAAHASAEPGILNWDTVIRESPADIYADSGFETISTNPCLRGDTRIFTSEGWQNIGNLVDKKVKFITPDGRTVDGKVWSSGVKNVIRLITSYGDEIYCTPNHWFLLMDGTRVTADQTLNHRLSHRESQNEFPQVISIEEVGEFEVFDFAMQDETHWGIIEGGYITHNCGEITLSAYDSCRLTVMNLFSYVIDPYLPTARFDFDLFDKHVMIAMRLMDDIVDLELEKIDQILEKIDADPEPDYIKAIEQDMWIQFQKIAIEGRRTGLGVTALGDTLAALGIVYGSAESISKTEEIYSALAVSSYKSSIKMAQERGPFGACDLEREIMSHPFLDRIKERLPNDYVLMWSKYGRRNIAMNTTAPVGSISLLTQTTSGIEPPYLLSYTRRRKVSENEENARVDFIDELGDKWQNYTVYHHGVKWWMDATGETNIEKSPYYGGTSNDVDWVASVDLQAAAQKWIDHSISKTCNLPADVTVDTVKEVYMRAWETGCKGFTIYRDGSRSGVLVADSAPEQKEKFPTHDAPQRPEELPCDVHTLNVDKQSWTVIIGLLDGRPYEVFGGLSEHIDVSDIVDAKSILRKRRFKTRPAAYDLIFDNGVKIKDIVRVFQDPEYGTLTRLLSTSLRHGTPIHFLVEQIQKGDKSSDFFSFNKSLARVLKTYIPDGTRVSTEKQCKNCGSDNLVYQEGCIICLDCGSSKCG